MIKGDYQPISDIYSKDLQKVIDLMLKVKSKKRLSAQDLLNHPIIEAKSKCLIFESK